MSTAETDLPPYEPQRILDAPFPERVRLVCRTWASQVSPNPMIVLVMYWTKYVLLFAGGWAFFVSFSAGYPGFGSVGAWAFTAVAFQKAMRSFQPWPVGAHAEALLRQPAEATS
jgi:hypothetical protein